jgi:hypothetical protein
MRHRLCIEVEQEHPAQNRRLVKNRSGRSPDLSSIHVNVVDRPICRIDAEVTIGAQNRLDEDRIKLTGSFWCTPPWKHEVKDQLVLVEVDRATAQAPAENRNSRASAIIGVYLQPSVLVEPDANIRIERVYQG